MSEAKPEGFCLPWNGPDRPLLACGQFTFREVVSQRETGGILMQSRQEWHRYLNCCSLNPPVILQSKMPAPFPRGPFAILHCTEMAPLEVSRGDVCERCLWQSKRAKRSGSGRNSVSELRTKNFGHRNRSCHSKTVTKVHPFPCSTVSRRTVRIPQSFCRAKCQPPFQGGLL